MSTPFSAVTRLGILEPEHPNLRIASGRSVTHAMLRAVADGNEVQAIKAFRASHPDATLGEARDAFAELSAKMADDA